MPRSAGVMEKIEYRGDVLVELVDVDDPTKIEYHLVRNTLSDLFRQATLLAVTGQSFSAPDYIAVGTGALAQYAKSNKDTTLVMQNATNSRLSQQFQVTANGSVDRALMYMQRIGTTTGSVYLEIQTDSAGLPSGTVLATSDLVPINGLNVNTVGFDWVSFNFSSKPALTTGTVYHLVLRTTGYSYSAAVTEVNVGADQSSPGYASGDGETHNGTSWAALSPASDLCFRVVAQSSISRATLLDEIDRNVMTSRTTPTAITARLLAVFTAAEAVDQLSEVAMFVASSGGNVYSVATIRVNKTSNQIMNVYWLVSAA